MMVISSCLSSSATLFERRMVGQWWVLGGARRGKRFYAPLEKSEFQPRFSVEAQSSMFQVGSSRRCGLIGRKVGMVHEWDTRNVFLPLTVIQVDSCQVIQLKTQDRDGYTAVQLGAGDKKLKRTTNALQGHFLASGVSPKQKVAEFRVSEDALLPVGMSLDVRHFLPGQYVDVTGISRGKGFAGVMKRWNFAGQGASHGNSVSHRVPGSTGNRQDPGRVFKGKKMPGRLGCDRTTVQNAWIYKIDPEKQLVYIKGPVPGPSKGWVFLRDAIKKRLPENPPFPTYFPSETDRKSPQIAEPVGPNPWEGLE